MHQNLIEAAKHLRSTAEAKRNATYAGVDCLASGRYVPQGLLAGMVADLAHAEACAALAGRLEQAARLAKLDELLEELSSSEPASHGIRAMTPAERDAWASHVSEVASSTRCSPAQFEALVTQGREQNAQRLASKQIDALATHIRGLGPDGLPRARQPLTLPIPPPHPATDTETST